MNLLSLNVYLLGFNQTDFFKYLLNNDSANDPNILNYFIYKVLFLSLCRYTENIYKPSLKYVNDFIFFPEF